MAQDNVTAPEQVFTLSDGDWVSTSLGLKAQRYNWTRDSTLFGGIFYCWAALQPESPSHGNVRIELAPSGKWIWMTGDQVHQALA